MRLLQYRFYDDIYIFLVDESIAEDVKVYCDAFMGYMNISLDVIASKVIESEGCFDSVEEIIAESDCKWKITESSDFKKDTDIEKLKESIIKLCNHYDIEEFWFDDENILKEGSSD